MPRRTNARPRVLLSEGASTSAREATTALGLGGSPIEICDPDAHCISRFSTFVHAVHRCPSIGVDPEGYLEFVIDLLRTGRFDVLLPIHEQGLIFAKFPERVPPGVGLALPTFEAYWTALDKARFTLLLAELGVPQPRTRIISDVTSIEGAIALPAVIKLAMSTASRGVKIVHTAGDIAEAKRELGPGEILVQQFVAGPLEHAQGVFDRGRFVAMHGYRQIVAGLGGGAAVKESVYRPAVRDAIEAIAMRLQWHGALSFDYILDGEVPRFVDSNPRLVEPMSAHLAGTDLVGSLVAVSCGEHPPEAPPCRAGVRTRLAMQAILGTAHRARSRVAVIRQIIALARGSGIYEGSREELTPLSLDWLGILPLTATAASVLLRPALADTLQKRGWGAGLLTCKAIEEIAAGFPARPLGSVQTSEDNP
jgi:predicted ATP-grasp superfamily ATP-dependent carboligase